MKLNPRASWGQARAGSSEEAVLASSERCLTLLVDGAARGALEVDATAYKNFRANIDELARRIPDRLPDEEKFVLIRSITQEFETYRVVLETALRERTGAWRACVTLVLEELIHDLGIDTTSPKVALLLRDLRRIASAEEITTWRGTLDEFLHPVSGASPAQQLAAKVRAADCSTANDNAAGLRGGGAAVEHLRKIMDRSGDGHGGDGHIVLFKLSCMDIVSQRFGAAAVEDCLMAVSAYLTAGLEGNDTIYHWSDSALLAILQGRVNELILTAELERIINQNRESTINIAGRSIMLRIPINFQITPINRLRNAEDLLRISARQATVR